MPRMAKENLIESLRLQVVCPAKARVKLHRKKDVELISGLFEICRWEKMFSRVDLDLEKELRKLVKKEIGKRYDFQRKYFSGYMHGHTYLKLIKQLKPGEKPQPQRSSWYPPD